MRSKDIGTDVPRVPTTMNLKAFERRTPSNVDPSASLESAWANDSAKNKIITPMHPMDATVNATCFSLNFIVW